MIDTHAHLTDDVFCGGEEEYVKALNAGVSTIFTIGYNLPSSVKAAEFACAHERAFFAAGVHPSDCESYDNGLIEALFVFKYLFCGKPLLNNLCLREIRFRRFGIIIHARKRPLFCTRPMRFRPF